MIEGKGLLFDTEYNNIQAWRATKIWCIAAVDLQTKELYEFKPCGEGEDQYHDQFGKEFVEFCKDYDYFVGHNFWGAEAIVCKNLLGLEFEPQRVIDTLVLSRVLRPMSPRSELFGSFNKKGWDTRVGGHSLDAWGKRLGFPKIEFSEFDRFSFDMMTYCTRDVELNLGVLEVLLKEIEEFNFDVRCLEAEHETHRLLMNQTMAGFKLEYSRAKKLYEDTSELIEFYLSELHKVFPKKKKLIEVYKPRAKNDGTLGVAQKKKLSKSMHEDNGDGTYNIYVMEEFNPSSPKQVGERLMDLGWNPRKFTATGQPSTDKHTLGETINTLALEVPEVEVLRKYNIVQHRNSISKEWMRLADESKEGRIHGRTNHVGPWTHRCSHFDPNMANIARVQLDSDGKPVEGLDGNFGWDSRHCWVVDDGNVLVGCDAAGIQLRALAHYMGDPDYIKEVCEGDIHTANQKAAGLHDRPTAKTFIYAWLLGAGDEKIGMICGVQDEEEQNSLIKKAQEERRWNRFRHNKGKREGWTSKDTLLWWVYDKLTNDDRKPDKKTVCTILKGYFTKKQFLDSLPALRRFKEEDIKEAASQGFMTGLDGRKIWIPSEHLAMGAYLQGFEATIMKWTMNMYQEELRDRGIWFQQVGFIHDEFQIETKPENAEEVGKTVVWAIREAGEILGSLCPLDGEYRIGKSWAETH